MAVTPFRAKAEERAKLKANESESPEPPSKRVCNTYEKQLAKLPKGDLQTVKDMGSGTVTAKRTLLSGWWKDLDYQVSL